MGVKTKKSKSSMRDVGSQEVELVKELKNDLKQAKANLTNE